MDHQGLRHAVRFHVLLILTAGFLFDDPWHLARAGEVTFVRVEDAHVACLLAQQLQEDGLSVRAARELRRAGLGVSQPTSRERVLRGSYAHSLGGWVVRVVVGFYREWIRPAIGSRCSLSPSCSEYFLTAARRHGWWAFPMMADRLVREPGLVSSAPDPNQRVSDPVDDHDWWLARWPSSCCGR